MTTLGLKPGLIRADTIDLQHHDHPSAKDHSGGQYQSGYTHAGTHHAQQLRNASHNALQEQQHSPQLGGFSQQHNGHNGHMYGHDDDEEDDHQMNGHHDDGYGDEDGDSQDDDMDDDLLDKISSSPSIEDEDIDFEFVYALHTFVATVEGQANATKGDTMVLLDDSNSYWWLVRVVKDGSIGYLPAEHIETPTERLARLNKHRNIDLSAAMLGDNPEKSKNPIKKAMRRRNAKTVNFAPPTYYEPDEQVWSDEEDEMDDDLQHEAAAQQEQNAQQQANHSGQQARSVEANDQQRANAATATIHQIDASDDEEDNLSSPTKSDAQAPAPLATRDETNSRSRNGTLRNTDSFYQEQETKKISLTPRLLRNDDTGAPQEQEVKERVSLDTFDKIAADEKVKDGKKKEKKGMLSGLFKRKDKGAKSSKDDEPDRTSEDSGRSPLSKDSMDSDTTPERKPSKLQKSQPGGSISSIRSSSSDSRPVQKEQPVASPTLQAPQQAQQQQPQIQPLQPLKSSLAPTQVQDQRQTPTSPVEVTTNDQISRVPQPQQEKEKRSVFAPLTGALRSKSSSQDMDAGRRPVYSKRSKERFAIDDSDSDGDSTPTAPSSALLHRSISPLAHGEAQPNRPQSHRVSPIQVQEPFTQPYAQPAETIKPCQPIQETPEQDAPSETPTSPSENTASTSKRSPSIPAHTPSTSRSTPTWSDASLRTYMDNDQDIRDLLVIVHDKTNVTPVGPEHPLMSGLFAAEKTRLADMEKQLDSMLMQWLAKKKNIKT